MRRPGNFWPYGVGNIPDQYIEMLNKNLFPVPNVTADEEGTAGHTITGSSGVYEDAELSVELPDSGTYLIWGQLRGIVSVHADSTYQYIVAKLYDSTAGAYITDSEVLVTISYGASTTAQTTAPILKVVTVDKTSTIKVYAARVADSTLHATAYISSSSTGKSNLGYILLNRR